ncbi:MAG: hypothetical protein QNJ75_12525 [Acidimicrobiia bacterium]|nr:hypothetical protein [Acidimicrobiia bacterium]
MDDILGRVALVAVVIAAAALVAFVSRRRPHHPLINTTGLGFGPGIVVFTSTACRRCKLVLTAAKATGAPLREVTFELEPSVQERAGVTGVPLTVVVDAAGNATAQFAGLVGERRLRRALVAAGL